MSLSARNIVLLDAVEDITGLAKGKEWDDVRRQLSGDHVREIYRAMAWLWPPETDLESLLPQPDGTLRALYLGTARPEVILDNVCRFSLYSDEILVVNPFFNPWCVAREYNPIVHPDQFKTDTLQLALFMILLDPWIRSGIVQLIPDPGDFDYSLRIRTWELAKERRKGWSPTEQDIEELEVTAKQDFARWLWRLPKGFQVETMRKAVPGITDKEIEETLQHIDELRRKDPLALDQSNEESGGELQIFRTGANLEMGMYIAQATGAFPYSNLRPRWQELLAVAQRFSDGTDVWTPLTHAFQRLDFGFLDHVDPRFAHSLRQEGRLEPFRGFLRKVWASVNTVSDPSRIDSAARDFVDELHEQHARAQAEWDRIDQDLLRRAGAAGAGAVTSGHFSLELPMLGFCIAAVVQLLEARMKRRAFRQTVPMSVFIDLRDRR